MSIFFEPLVKASYFHKKILFVGNTIEAKSRDIKIFFFRYAFLKVLKRLDWSNVAGLTQSGGYSEYISHLQNLLQKNRINFIENRKFQPDSKDMTLVIFSRLSFSILSCSRPHSNGIKKYSISIFSL